MTDSLQQRKTLWLLVLSFLIISVCGTAFLMAFWSQHGSAVIGVKRSAVFVTLMVAVHAIGAALSLSQYGGDARVHPIFPGGGKPLRDAIRFAIVQQFLIVGLSFLVLDGGYAVRCWHIACVAFVAHWLVIRLVLGRSPGSPSFGELCLIRYGFVPLCLLFGTLAASR